MIIVFLTKQHESLISKSDTWSLDFQQCNMMICCHVYRRQHGTILGPLSLPFKEPGDFIQNYNILFIDALNTPP